MVPLSDKEEKIVRTPLTRIARKKQYHAAAAAAVSSFRYVQQQRQQQQRQQQQQQLHRNTNVVRGTNNKHNKNVLVLLSLHSPALAPFPLPLLNSSELDSGERKNCCVFFNHFQNLFSVKGNMPQIVRRNVWKMSEFFFLKLT